MRCTWCLDITAHCSPLIITDTGSLYVFSRHALAMNAISLQWSSDIKAINTDQNGFPRRAWGCGTWVSSQSSGFSLSHCWSVCCSWSERKVKVSIRWEYFRLCVFVTGLFFPSLFQFVAVKCYLHIAFAWACETFDLEQFVSCYIYCIYKVINTQACHVLTSSAIGVTVQFYSNGGEEGEGFQCVL